MSEAEERGMDIKNSDTIEDLRVLLAEAAPGPWHLCRANGGECSCGLVWSVPADCVVATCSVPREDAPGDEPVTARHRANGRLLAAAVTHLPELLDRLEAAEAAVRRERARCLAWVEHIDRVSVVGALAAVREGIESGA